MMRESDILTTWEIGHVGAGKLDFSHMELWGGADLGLQVRKGTTSVNVLLRPHWYEPSLPCRSAKLLSVCRKAHDC